MEDVEVLRAFGVLNRIFLPYFSHALADKGLSYSEGIILANVGAQPGTMQDALARDLVIDKAAVARAVKGLKEKGVVHVNRSTSDRRAHELWLSSKGEALVREIGTWNDTWIRLVTADLGARERATFFTALGKIVERAKKAPLDTLVGGRPMLSESPTISRKKSGRGAKNRTP